MADAHPRRPTEPDSHERVIHFSHGDHQGFEHLQDLFQLIRAELHLLPHTSQAKYASAIAGMATAQLHAVKQHRERNLHDLVQLNTEYPARHPNNVVALQRFRHAQRQLSSLEDQLAGQLTHCAVHSTALGQAYEVDAVEQSSVSDLILLEDEPIAEKLQVGPASPASPESPATPSDSSESHSNTHSNMKQPTLIIPAGCAAAPASRIPDGHDPPSTGRTDAPRGQPEIMVPNEDLLDNLWDNDRMRNQAIRTYVRQNGSVSPIFRYGIRYLPKPNLPLRAEQERSDYECRTVVISHLSTRAKIRDVLGAVRGGKLLRATIVQLDGISTGATAMVQFANWRDAHAYSEHAKSHAIVLYGRKCSVALAGSPSYPISPASMNALEQGFTRCIEIKEASVEEVAALISSLRRWFPRVQDMLEDVLLDLGGNKLVLRFRDLDFATKVYRLVKNGEALFPVLHRILSFVADPCDEPFKTTLDEPQTTANGSICLMDVIGNPSWNIQSAYPELGQTAGTNIDIDTSNPSSSTSSSTAAADPTPDLTPIVLLTVWPAMRADT
ncbi:hypothetical protein PG997_003993 [Apiospora hydei]|uniref:RRM domain-containing protein n=1 Tax=Apiospora hydei TaxID=1337664 RepID=A0ABR1X0S6_9PEZI